MNFKKIKATDYLKGMKWSLMPKNSIDTIKGKYIPNTTLEEETTVASATIKKVTINGQSITLPITPRATNMDKTVSMYNVGTYYNSVTGQYADMVETARGEVGVIYGTIEATLKSDKPVVSGAHLVISLSGISKNTAHATGSSGDYVRHADTLASALSAVSSQPESPWADDSASQKYSEGSIILNPFMKKAYSNGSSIDGEDVNVQWDHAKEGVGTNDQKMAGTETGWNMYGVSGAYYVKGSVTSNKMYYKNETQVILQNFQQVDQYTFRVSLKVPVELLGVGKACLVRWVSYYIQERYVEEYSPWDMIDGYCFLDLLKEINIEIKGFSVDNNKFDFGYSLDNNKDLTTNLKNLNVFTFIDSELVTLSTTWNGTSWMEKMSKYILDAYEKGKYIAEFDIYLKNGLSKNLAINSPLKIFQLDGLPIRRDNRDIIFSIKTIEKQVNNGSYLMHIKALEETSMVPEDFKALLVYKRNITISSDQTDKYLIDLRANAPTLQLTANESDYYGNTATRYGYSVALTSDNSIVEENSFLLPGDPIGTKIAICMRTESVYEVSNFEIGLANTSRKFIDTHVEVFNASGTNNRYYVAIVDVGSSYKRNLTLYVKCSALSSGRIAINLYNLSNFNVTREETINWIVENHKEPTFS